MRMEKPWRSGVGIGVLILLLLLLGGALLTQPHPVSATFLSPETELFSDDISGDYICSSAMTLRHPESCPRFSPGARVAWIAYVRSRLPNPLPELAVEELDTPAGAVTDYSFAYIRPLPAATYGHPEEAAVGMPPLREFLAGDNWVSVLGQVEYNGELWYEINKGEYVRANHVAFTTPSRFAGIVLNEQPRYPFGWINRDVTASAVPGGSPIAESVFRRYDRITIYASQLNGDQMWYMIGPDQWIEQSYTARVDVDPPPEGVAPGEKWIEINTFEQTLAAYEGERMVFATLVSSGRSSTWTPNGLTRIWGKLPSTPMVNRDVTSDSPAWYYLEDVEWTQYFNGAYALHAAYWHNSFSFTRSHGCVNLSILDAKWLFDWTSPYVPENTKIVYSGDGAGAGTWVWVHMAAPYPNVESGR